MKRDQIVDIYPLSPLQQGMLFHTLQAPRSGFYVLQLSCTLHGPLDVPALEEVCRELLERHSVLRTAFVWQRGEEPHQVVFRRVRLPRQELDWREHDPAAQECKLEALLAADREEGFDLRSPPLMRLRRIRLAEDRHLLVWSAHHLLMDGWSAARLLEEVVDRYAALCRGERLELEPARPYADYIAWLEEQDLAAAEAFWREQLVGFSTPVAFGTKHPASPAPGDVDDYDERFAPLSRRTTRALEELARSRALTASTLAHGAFALLLRAYGGQDDVAFGTVVSGRPPGLPGSQSMVGLFLNTLPMRVRVPPESPLLSWLGDLQDQQLELQHYTHTPLVQIQRWSEVPRGRSLFDGLLTFHNRSLAAARDGGSDGTRIGGAPTGGEERPAAELRISTARTNYPLSFDVHQGERMLLQVTYDRRHFDRCDARRMLVHFENLLAAIAAGGARRLGELTLFTPTERHQLCREWNDTAGAPSGSDVPRIFADRARAVPDSVAVVHDGASWTYGELARRAAGLAAALAERGIGQGATVALMAPRGSELVAAILGSWSAGACYLPLEASHPRRRTSQTLERSGARLVLVSGEREEEALAAALAEMSAERPAVLRLADVRPGTAAAGGEPRRVATDPAYLMFTSGSTGTPKGAMVPHHAMLCHLAAKIGDLELGDTDAVAQTASQCFDISVWQLLAALMVGGRVRIVPDARAKDPALLLEEVATSRATVLEAVASFLGLLIHEISSRDGGPPSLPALRRLVNAGEALPPVLVRRWFAAYPEIPVLNAYGPTECADAVAHHPVPAPPAGDGPWVSIGRPLLETQLHVLDPGLRLVPVHVAGELYIGGTKVGGGYLGDPARTARAFLPDPFAIRPGRRLYRTGDRAYRRAGGELEFIERIDFQVKIRGFRVELGEIEAALREHDAVRECVVLARERFAGAASASADRRIVAYLVERDGAGTGPGDWRAFLEPRLPAYMVPSAFVSLDALPRMPNGKLDRSSLPEPGAISTDRDYLPPRNPEELQLVQIWEELLDTRPVGVTDDFFDLGGHSLLALRLVSRIRHQFGRDLPLSVLVENVTVERLAGLLQHGKEGAATPLAALQPAGERTPLYLLHPIGGGILGFVGLARHLGPDQPIFAFEAPDPSQIAASPPVEETAADYVAHLLAARPRGPYLLGGWSSGGVIAFEMAQQLRRAGREVAMVALLDTWSPRELAKLLPPDDGILLAALANDHARQQGSDWKVSLRDLEGIAPERRLDFLLAELQRANLAPAGLGTVWIRRFLAGMKARQLSMLAYRPRMYPDRVVMFSTREIDPQLVEVAGEGVDFDDLTHGWADFAEAPIEVHEVPGDHATLVFEPHVATLAEKLTVALRATRPDAIPRAGGEVPGR